MILSSAASTKEIEVIKRKIDDCLAVLLPRQLSAITPPAQMQPVYFLNSLNRQLLVFLKSYLTTVKYYLFKRVGLQWQMLIFGLLSSFSASGQYSNSWINFNQSYFKVQVAKDGIHRLTSTDLQNANFPVNTVDPRLIKLYHRGREQAIFVQGESDAVFNPTDFIEFYGQKNDGTLDKNLYKPSTLQPHSFYNLYSDTTAYFLTYSLIPPAGKRMSSFSEVNVTAIPKENFHSQQRLVVAVNSYSAGASQNGEIYYTYFDQGEGWMGTPLQQNQTIDYVIDLVNNSAPTGGLPKLELQLIGRDNIPHSAEILIGANSGSLRSIATNDFFGFETPLITSTLNWSDVGADGKITVRLKAAFAGTNRFQFSVGYIKLSFPQNFNAAGLTEKVFRLTSTSPKSYIELDNAPSTVRLWDITDGDNVSAIGTRVETSALSAVVSNTSSPRILLASNIIRTPSIKPISFRSINPAQPNFLIISNRALMKPALGYSNVVQAYAAFRASEAGGKYDTLSVSVDQLYDQFNYGETSPLGIYEFMRFMVNNGNPKFLFIIGKGRDVYSFSGYQRSSAPTNEFKDLVPSAGIPASDMAFTAGLGGTTFEPKVATGRLPASTPAQVAAYLNKIIETEAAPLAADWKKQGLHLSGGIQAFELPLFRSYVDGFKAVAEGNYWGGNIATIGKRDSNPVQLINVSDQVNKGTNLITFFGHSSPGTIDVDIGFVSDPVLGYNNPGKYPVFLINGCNAGAFFLNGTIFGEDWILAANKGARNFIAHASLGYSNTLQAYSDLFYKVGFGDSTFIQRGIGEVQQEVGKRYLNAHGNNVISVSQIQQMVLLGDPAVKLFGTAKPDYSIDNSSLSLVSLDGAPVTSLSPFFGVKIVRKNLGATGSEAVPIRIIRTFADNTSKTYDSIFANVLNQDTIIFKLLREPNGSGLNQLTAVIDPFGTIKEINKQNNTATLNALIPSNGTKNLFPFPFSIVNKQTLNLVFQSTDPTSGQRDFQIQLDTSSTFSSAFLKSQVVSGKVVAKLNVSLLANDSTVYFWRTKLDKPKANESVDWTTSSFTFIRNAPEGWGQLKFPQLIDNETPRLLKDSQLRKLSYLETFTPFSVTTFGNTNSQPVTNVSLKISNVEFNIGTQGQPCRNNTINLVAFNKNTAVPYAGIPFGFQDARTCGREPQLINSFLLNELETTLNDDLATYVDAIQQSDSVLIFSIGNPGYSSWSANVKSKLGNFGISAAQINLLLDGEPVIILGKKGAAVGSARVFRAAGTPITNQILTVSKTMTGRFSSGSVKSAVIGPAKNWIQFINQVTRVEPSDEFGFSVFGRSLDGVETLLLDNVKGNLDLSFINAQAFPFLRIEMKMQDEVNLTAVQLRKWIVQYETVAEGVTVYTGSLVGKTAQEGQAFSNSYGFVNISEKTFPGQLNVRVDVLNKTSGANSTSTLLIDPPKPGDTTKFSVAVDTKAKVGANDISVFVNPKILPEQYYDNNIVSLLDFLTVVRDATPPSLKVTFDGRVLRNKDFVSKNPQIVINLQDENPFLFKTDTLGVSIFLKHPCNTASCPLLPIFFKRSDLKWSPATASTPFQIKFNPSNLASGEYSLRVEGVDASGNKSGAKPYEVDFQVNDTTTLSLQAVFPNPSAASFFFNFELKGNIVPDDFQLQIYSLDGRLLRDFGKDNIQFFHIGFNEIRWDALDASGNSLPSGIYLYRIRIAANGNTYPSQGRLVLSR